MIDKKQLRRQTIRWSKRIIPLLLLLYFLPWLTLFFILCGIIDFSRNHLWDWSSINRYFFGNGMFTWLLSPFNLLVDCFCRRNHGVYQIEQLPQACQQEINTVIDVLKRENIVQQLQDKMQHKKRGMIFFKWYGKNVKTSLTTPELHQSFDYVKTIGISVFNKRQSTSWHFGPLRLTLRVLYNLTPIDSRHVYIEAKKHQHFWCDNPLYIFDDTLMHQSVNDADDVRYCMFVDIMRPSYLPQFLYGLLRLVRLAMLKFNGVFYKNWDFIK